MYSQCATLAGHSNDIIGLAVSDDSQVLVSTSMDRTVRVWETATWSLRHVIDDMDLETHQGILVFDLSPCGQYLATGMADFTTKVYSLNTGQRLARLHPEKKSSYNTAEQVRFSPDSELLACAKGKTIELFETRTFAKVGELKGHTSKAHLLDWSPDARTLISCGGKYVKLWDIASLTERLELTQHKKLLGSLATDSHGEFFVTGGEDNRIFVWSLPDATMLGEYRDHTNYVFDLAISPDGQTIASWDMDRSLHLWDRATCTNLARLPDVSGHSKFLPTTTHLIFSDPKSGALVIDATNGDIIQKLAPSTSVAVAADGRWFACTEGNDIAIWSST